MISLHSNKTKNTDSPSFQLELTNLLKLMSTCEYDTDMEMSQATVAVRRYMSTMKKTYDYYSSLGFDSTSSADNTFVMSRLQFWRFIKDCKLDQGRHTIMAIDRFLGSFLPANQR